ncbi:MAG TPA: shikimate dehydrogenase [Marmoricola sp.]|nr:shikimate dehydrogenase [Marmoricola sp.]
MRCAVLGSPIEHSLSPVLHRAAYAELGLDWHYDAVEVRESELAGFMEGLDASWRGLSLTMPLKRTVIDLLDESDPLVAVAGVANTVVLDAGRRKGFNTDIPGAASAIREQVSTEIESALILGGGATAVSLGWALADLGCTSLRLFVRNLTTVAETVGVIKQHPQAPDVEVHTLDALRDVEPAQVVASTIPVPAQDAWLLSNLEAVDPSLVFDVIYDPWPTPLASWANETGRSVVSGLDLLVHQAALQVELMTGHTPSIDAMREAGLRALADRSHE